MLFTDIIRWHGHKTPARTAVISGDRVYTYGLLLERVNRLANAMAGLGQHGDRVGIIAENLPEYIEAYYGVPDAGMSLNLLNYRLHPKEWAWILNNSEARILIIQEKFLELMEAQLGDVPSIEHVIVIGNGTTQYPSYEDVISSASPIATVRDIKEDDMAWLVYTSGTTGFPKGAMLSHRNLLIAAMNSVIEYDMIPETRNLMAFPLCHIAGYQTQATHFRGGAMILFPVFEPEIWMQEVEKHGITNSGFAPTMLNMILEHPNVDKYDLSTLRSVLYGAAAMPAEVLRRGIERLGPVVYSGFGMTELGGNVLTFPKSDHVRAINGEEHLLVSCGKPMVMSEVKVVNENMVECKPGEVGEIIVRGEQVLKGYFNNEEGTIKAFEGGWFHTGDLAKRDEEGFFYIVDRMKDMIITGGENVYSREVEEVLYTHPAVSEAAVIGLPDPKWGENVVAVIVLKQGQSATEAEIIAAVKDRLAGFKKPKRVFFIDEMPKTVSGKLIKRELRDRFKDS